MSTYNETYLTKNVSASSPIPGRTKDMKTNLAGGYSFKANDFMVLRRWLLTGSMSNLYYQNSFNLTNQNVSILEKCVASSALKTAEEILYASNKGINNHTPLLALVYLSMGDFIAKKKFREIFNSIVRTASHLYEFFSYCKNIRGMGKTINKAVKSWLDSKDAKELEYQFLKYQQRNGWSARDVLRLIKPKTNDKLKNFVYAWVTGKDNKDFQPTEELSRLFHYNLMKNKKYSQKELLNIIYNFNLTHEMIPSNIERTTDIWETLFMKMPVNATIRNLGNLTNKGIFQNIKNIDILEKKLSGEILKRARVHPLNITNAYKIYKSGSGLKGRLSWTVIPRICDLLEEAIENSFDTIESTGKIFFHAMDISPSMKNCHVGNLALSPRDIAAIMALSSIRSEKNYFVGGFASNFIPLPDFRKGVTFSNALGYLGSISRAWGGTNASAAYEYAINNKIHSDVFVFWTDNESWQGGHPAQGLNSYRKKINKNAKAIYVTLAPYGDKVTLADPKDSRSYDLAGFSSETPKLIQLIAKGDL